MYIYPSKEWLQGTVTHIWSTIFVYIEEGNKVYVDPVSVKAMLVFPSSKSAD
jgi:hypothetical protein